MSDVLLDQIEFRWTDRDVSAIAASNLKTQAMWHKRLKGWVRFRDDEHAAVVAGSSGVYLTFDDGLAALVLRSLDDRAIRVSEAATPDRHEVVARVLVAPGQTLSAQYALELMTRCALELSPRTVDGGSVRQKVLEPPAGQVLEEGYLPSLRTPAWRDSPDREAFWQEHHPGKQPGLLQLVAAVLRAPDQPVTFYLDGSTGLDLTDSPASRLLWMLHEVVTPILTDAAGEATYGWRPTFSTFETPDEREPSALPGVTFRMNVQRAGTAVYPNHRVPEDLAGNAARSLMRLLDSHRSAARAEVDRIVKDLPHLEDRLRALSDNGRSIAATRTHAPAVGVRQGAPSTDHSYAPLPDESGRQATNYAMAADTVPGQIPQSEIQPPADDPRCLPLYTKLGRFLEWEQTRELERDSGRDIRPSQKAISDFRTTVAWFGHAAKWNWHLPAEEQDQVLQILAERGPYLKRALRTLYGAQAGERMAHVFYPLFAPAAAAGREYLSSFYGETLRRNPSFAEAVPIMCSLLGPQRGGDLLAEVAFAPLHKNTQSKDPFDPDQGSREGGRNPLVLGLTMVGKPISEPVAGLLAIACVVLAFLLILILSH
jgi:hypothetical protein